MRREVHLLIDYDESYRCVERRKEPLMTLSIQQLADDSKFSHAMRFEVLEQLCPRELVSELLSRCHAWGERERSLNQLLVVYYVISLSLFRRINLAAVLAHLVRGLRWLWSNPSVRLPTAAALVYRRRQLGTPVIRHLFQRVCHPMPPHRPG